MRHNIHRRRLLFSLCCLTVCGAHFVRGAPPALITRYTDAVQPAGVRRGAAGQHVHVAGWSGYDSYQAFDVTNAASPRRTGSLAIPYSGESIEISPDESRVYTAGFFGGVQIICITNPAAPEKLGVYNNGNSRVRDFVVSHDGATVFVLDESFGVEVLQVTDPAAPVRIGRYDEAFTNGAVVAGTDLSSDDATLFVAAAEGGLKILSVTNRSEPRLIGQYDLPAGSGPMRDVFVSANDSLAFLVGDGSSGLAAFHIVDVADPRFPTLLGSYTDSRRHGNFVDLTLSRDEQTVFIVGHNAGLQILNVTRPDRPTYIAEFYEVINSTTPQTTGVCLLPDENTALLAENANGLIVVDVSGVADIDNDGLPNAWEMLYYTNLTSAASGGDSDGDGQSNRREYVAGTDPWNRQSFFRLEGPAGGPWPGARVKAYPGRVYGLWRADELAPETVWQAVSSAVVIAATEEVLTLIDTNASAAGVFYKAGVDLDNQPDS